MKFINYLLGQLVGKDAREKTQPLPSASLWSSTWGWQTTVQESSGPTACVSKWSLIEVQPHPFMYCPGLLCAAGAELSEY